MKLRIVILCAFLALSGPALALSPNEILPDAALEQRAREISAGLRCLVCQNQSIDDSDADLARDLRVLVRERLVAGDSNAEVEQFLVDRYGEYVLLNPRLGAHTVLLWIAAPILLLAGLAALLLARRKTHSVGPSELSAEEASALAELEREQPRP
ncbi:cytochrome c-type biogenesis protein [Devosia rhizoryzae]|uniref:Cytochrome c-type biogenesis protein n=1 Tax=Devosia rhizoryzae TaxID=2774137 RepID=A0ABX7C7J4_9HYPH|nr:cytochrome c-type biogenesis protein [Devosia rhizoryzae]QQR37931.1 cytochrome c-type biogenesis protein CcmH [Devosia rhizoryzae]